MLAWRAGHITAPQAYGILDLNSSRVLIAGYGYVGSALARLLVDRGDTVWGLRRHVPRDDASGVRFIQADLEDEKSLRDLPAQLDQVVFCASAGGTNEEAYKRLYLNGLEAFLASLKNAPHVFFTSSTSVYAQLDGSWVDESSPTEPNSFAGRIMLQAEQLVQSQSLPSTVIRFGGIYGPERTRLIRVVDKNEVTPAQADNYTNRIHRDDCAGALAHLTTLAKAEPLYIGVDDSPALRSEVLAYIASELGKPTPPLGVADTSARGRSNKRCSNRSLKQSGYQFRYPSYRDGYSELIQAYLQPD